MINIIFLKQILLKYDFYLNRTVEYLIGSNKPSFKTERYTTTSGFSYTYFDERSLQFLKLQVRRLLKKLYLVFFTI